MPDAARMTDSTSHGAPLAPGAGSPNVLIGHQKAWRALPAGSTGAALESVAEKIKAFMSAGSLTPAQAGAQLAQIQSGLVQAGITATSEGNTGAATAAANANASLTATNATLTATWSAASAPPGAMPAATAAYTEAIKAALSAAAGAVFSSVAAAADMHNCPKPCPNPLHGPGVVTRGSKTVFINGLPATRKGDKVVEACGGQDAISAGCATVLIGDLSGLEGLVETPAPATTEADAGDDPSDAVSDAQEDGLTTPVGPVDESTAGPLKPVQRPQASAPVVLSSRSSVKPASPTSDWLGVVLRDFDHTPMPKQEFSVTLQDGRILKGTTDAEGRGRFEGLTPGSGQVTFPGISDRSASDTTPPNEAPNDASDASPVEAAPPLTRPASTGRDNTVEVAPFEVRSVQCSDFWDPEKARLEVRYELSDPNGQAEFGRVLYCAPPLLGADRETAAGRPVVVHSRALRREQLADGAHELVVEERWDGTITEGLPERVGQRVTQADSPVRVIVQTWNRDPAPPPPEQPDEHPSGRHVSHARDHAYLDGIVEARWDRSWCIPYGDPDEPKQGEAAMHIRVRGIADGTPVRLMVVRIGDPKSKWSADDRTYAQTGDDAESQPGLEGAVVRGGKVVRADGGLPFVRFNRYLDHWAIEGNNFYAFQVALGERGRFQAASQRDYEARERECLHMRFTVFIHRPAGDLGYSTASARKLHRFLRDNTKYFRSYLMEGPAKDLETWRRHFRNRYIVIVLGHASCFCTHPDHPRKKKNPDEFVELLHRGFDPDRYVCPNEMELEGFFTITEDMKKYNQEWFDGCGNKSHVTQWANLGRLGPDEKIVLYNTVETKSPSLVLSRQKRQALDPKNRDKPRPWEEAEAMPMDPDEFPRLMFYNGGCRTMLTTNFGDPLIQGGTRYHTGWVYSVLDEVDGRFLPDLFERWIRGTRAAPAPVEFDGDRLPGVFSDLATRGGAPEWHARIMDGNGVLNHRPKPDALSRKLQ